MALPRHSLRGFLTHAKGVLRAALDSNQKVTLVIGNESADLDSMSCSILYAYLRSMSPPRNAFTSVYVPIANLPAEDIRLRPEYLAVFKHANIEEKQLITLDDLPAMADIQAKLRPENTEWILVDHNALQGQLGKIYSERVAGVIDHHDEENKVRKDTGDEPRVIEKTGSCTSLVVRYCQQAWDTLSESTTSSGVASSHDSASPDDTAEVQQWDADVAQLGLASILIDTANLHDESKTTDDDRSAVEYLEAKIMHGAQSAGRFDRERFYREINQAKKDIGGLKLQDILRKDYKQWDQDGQKLGVSSVVKAIDFLQTKAGDEANTQASEEAFLSGVEKFAKHRELDTYAIMTTSTSDSGKFQRELLLWAFNDRAVSGAKKFAKQACEELGLEDWQGSSRVVSQSQVDGQWRRVWQQRQVQHSRKRVGPLLREAMK